MQTRKKNRNYIRTCLLRGRHSPLKNTIEVTNICYHACTRRVNHKTALNLFRFTWTSILSQMLHDCLFMAFLYTRSYSPNKYSALQSREKLGIFVCHAVAAVPPDPLAHDVQIFSLTLGIADIRSRGFKKKKK